MLPFSRHTYRWSGIDKHLIKCSSDAPPVWLIAFADPIYHEIMLLEAFVAEIVIINSIIVSSRALLHRGFKFLMSNLLQLNAESTLLSPLGDQKKGEKTVSCIILQSVCWLKGGAILLFQKGYVVSVVHVCGF